MDVLEFFVRLVLDSYIIDKRFIGPNNDMCITYQRDIIRVSLNIEQWCLWKVAGSSLIPQNHRHYQSGLTFPCYAITLSLFDIPRVLDSCSLGHLFPPASFEELEMLQCGKGKYLLYRKIKIYLESHRTSWFSFTSILKILLEFYQLKRRILSNRNKTNKKW